MNDLRGQQDHGLAAFLLGRAAMPDAIQVRAAMLGAFAYTALPPGRRRRSSFRADYLNGVARHLSIKAEVTPLVAAWRAAGIEVLIWKGFHLAEFVYPVPGMRFHGDVDVLLHSRDLRTAGRIAAELGWTGARDPRGPPYAFCHNAYALVRGGPAFVDIHRYVLHRPSPVATRQGRLTRTVWDRSIEVEWEGTTVRLPHAVDAVLICLLLHRAWGSDRWSFKAHDLLDFRYLIERAGVTRTALDSRAAELGCRRTFAVLLDRCDPWAGRFDPHSPSPAEAWRFDVRTLPEHAPYRFEQWLGRALRTPDILLDTIRALPLVLHVRRVARREPDLHRLLVTLTPPMPAHRSGAPQKMRLVTGVRWATWLIRSRGVGAGVIRSLAIYRALRQQGWPVEFVSGIRRDANRLSGNAWVEINGHVLPELRELSNPTRYRVNFRHPAPESPPPAHARESCAQCPSMERRVGIGQRPGS